ncbi:hypothetical protein AXN05_13155 [Salmonella enterica subsp. enterica]|nr:hypothetical protein [Salmonella enterica subsp. enterica]
MPISLWGCSDARGNARWRCAYRAYRIDISLVVMPDGTSLIGPTALILAWWSCLMALRLSGLQKFIAIY